MSQELLDACMEGDLNTIKDLLLNKNIDIHYQDSFGVNCLMFAAWRGHLEIVKYLLTSDELTEHANINFANTYNNTAFIYACKQGHLDIIKYLVIEHEFPVNDNTMSWLIKNNKTEILQIIEKRDLYQKMNNNLSDSGKKLKHRKI